MYQQPQPFNPITQVVDPVRNVRKSKILIGCGTLHIVLNTFLTFFCIAFLCTDDHYRSDHVYSVTLVCATYHIIGGTLAIFGGANLQKYNCCSISSLVLGIVGVLFVIPVLITCVINWIGYHSDCNYKCTEYHSNAFCGSCGNVTDRFLPLLLATLLVGINDITLASGACYNVCKCCRNTGTSNSAVVISQPSYAYNSAQPNQIHAIYSGSTYPQQYYAASPPPYAANQQQQQSVNYERQIQHDYRAPIFPPRTNYVK
uniref:Uncharacterized protein n=1 Tax=Strigamia maritima TaxID=126957 RepID=T1ITW8_STRMM